MAEQNCNRYLDYFVKLVSYTRSFSLCFRVLNFGFSLVATLGNLLVIRALMKNSTIPATYNFQDACHFNLGNRE